MIMPISALSHFKMMRDVLMHVDMNNYHLLLSLWMLYNDFMIFLTEKQHSFIVLLFLHKEEDLS
jgi:hypothetical protein